MSPSHKSLTPPPQAWHSYYTEFLIPQSTVLVALLCPNLATIEVDHILVSYYPNGSLPRETPRETKRVVRIICRPLFCLAGLERIEGHIIEPARARFFLASMGEPIWLSY